MNLIKNFYIDLITYNLKDDNVLEEIPIRLTSFENNSSNLFGSFDENLKTLANEVQEFTFSIYLNSNGIVNPFWYLLKNDRKLSLTIEGGYYGEFNITNISPSISPNNIKYTITCQDTFSYELSRRNLNTEFSTDSMLIWGNDIGPKPIDKLVNKLLEYCDITDWKLNSEINTFYIPFVDNLHTGDEVAKVSLETSSTPFGILVEIANIFNAFLKVDYKTHTIDFISKDQYLTNIYDLRPDYNINNFSYGEKGEELYNILYVQGGEDAYGNYVSLIPKMPVCIRDTLIENNFEYEDKTIDEIEKQLLMNHNSINSSNTLRPYDDLQDGLNFLNILKRVKTASSMLYDFSYWKDNELIDNTIFDSINKELSFALRNINLDFLCMKNLYDELLLILKPKILEEQNIIQQIAAEEELFAYNTEEMEQELSFYTKALTTTINVNNKDIKCIKIFEINKAPEISDVPLNKQNLHYGEIKGADCAYYLPDFIDCYNSKGSNGDIECYIIYTEEEKEIAEKVWITCNLNNNTFNLLTDNSIKTNCSIIVPIVDNIFEPKKEVNLDGLKAYKKINLTSDLFSIWNDTYFNCALNIYGKDYLDKKIKELEDLLLQGRQKYSSILYKLQKLTGKTEEEDILDITTSDAFSQDINKYLAYSDLLAQRKSLLTKIGGLGTRKSDLTGQLTEYPGYYQVYLDNLYLLKEIRFEYIENFQYAYKNKNKSLEQLIEDNRECQKQWQKNFYNSYSSIIREAEFSDEDQLDSDGLYAAASKQFFSYKEPGKSYSASMITTNDLIQPYEDINIGDQIRITCPQIFNKKSDDHLIIYIRKNFINKFFNQKFFLNNVVNITLMDDNVPRMGIIEQVITDNIYHIFIIKLNTKIDFSLFKCCKIKVKNFNFIIEKVLNHYESKPVLLQISGLNKSLRSSVTELTVEQKSLVNHIIDKMLYNFK